MIINIGIPIELEFPYRIKREVTNFPWVDSKPSTSDFWIPGVVRKLITPGDGYVFCHGLGKRVLTPLAIAELAGRRHDRVIYENKWIDPDGMVLGTPRLALCTKGSFRRMSTMAPEYEEIYTYEEGEQL